MVDCERGNPEREDVPTVLVDGCWCPLLGMVDTSGEWVDQVLAGRNPPCPCGFSDSLHKLPARTEQQRDEAMEQMLYWKERARIAETRNAT